MPTIKRVAIYARVSTSEQTTDNQVPVLSRYSLDRGWTVFREYIDQGVSGAKDSRPALDRLMLDARKRHFDVVLVWRFDRFARSSTHLLTALDEFRILGVDFVSLNEAVDTSTPMGKMVFTICAAVAELERSIIIERVKAGIQRARNEGKKLGRPRADLDSFEVVSLRNSGLSLRQIAQKLNVPKSTIADVLKSLVSEKPSTEAFI